MSLNIKNLVDVVLRQTDYTEEKAIEKLKEHNNDIIAIVREYMCGTAIKKPQTIDTTNKSMNQQIYGEIRNLMDDAAKTYKAKKDLEKRREDYIAFMQARQQEAQAKQEQEQLQAQAQQEQLQAPEGALETSVSAQGAESVEAPATATN